MHIVMAIFWPAVAFRAAAIIDYCASPHVSLWSKYCEHKAGKWIPPHAETSHFKCV